MIRLELLKPGHIDFVMSWVNDPGVTQYFANLQRKILCEEELVYIERMIASETDRVYSVFDGDDYIGQASINQIYWPSGEGRIFLVVRKEKQGKGYGEAILKELQRVAFIELDLHRLFLIVRPANEKGVNLYKKCGFRTEGFLYDKYKINGRWIDMVQMAIIKPWWEKTEGGR